MSQSDSLSKVAVEYETALNLIDVVFSLECCLHYQVLPLELSDNHLVIGMVDPKNKDTIQHLNPIINSLGHTFHIQSIDTQTHQLVLATYLKSGPKNSPTNSQNGIQESKIIAPPIIIETPVKNESPQQRLNYDSTLIDIPETESPQQKLNYDSTLIDIPETESPQQKLNYDSTLVDIPEHKLPNLPNENLHERPTFIIGNEEENPVKKSQKSQIFFGEAQINQVTSTRKSIPQDKKIAWQSSFQDTPEKTFEQYLESLKSLPPEKLWQNLLSGILIKGISKVNLQQNRDFGHIICYQNELIKSSSIKISLVTFQEVIKEIKMMAKLPLNALTKNKKIAIPKYYNDEKILLRIQFFVDRFEKEEIIIQGLRGHALKFYEQKQVDKTLEQAIHLGQKLEKILKKIKICQDSADLGDLKTLKIIMQNVEQQLRSLD